MDVGPLNELVQRETSFIRAIVRVGVDVSNLEASLGQRASLHKNEQLNLILRSRAHAAVIDSVSPVPRTIISKALGLSMNLNLNV